MASMAALRKQAKELGMPKGLILRAETPEELQSFISDFQEHDEDEPKTPRKKSAVKKAVKKATKKTTARKATDRKQSGRKSAPAKRSTAKRRTTPKANKVKRSNGYVPKGGRNLLEGVNFSNTDGWNPRKGSAPERIMSALKKNRGNRAKAFEELKKDVWFFVGKKKADGSKRNLTEAHKMLKYRISRTLFDFAIRTGQHEVAENRVEYGTGDTGQGIWKPAKRRQTAKAKTAPKTKTKSRSVKRTTAKKATKRATKARAKAGSRR